MVKSYQKLQTVFNILSPKSNDNHFNW